MGKIAFFEITPVEKEFVQKSRLGRLRPLFLEGPPSEAKAATLKSVEVASVFIYSSLNAETLRRMPRLKMIATRSTGFDHIDLAVCRKRGIVISNVPSYGENTVAEHTFALILALSRKVHQAYFRTIRGDFSFEGLEGFDLNGKTLGILGTGHIGLHVARIARGFGMKVIAFDVRQNPFMAETLGFEYVPFERLLGGSDILTLHAPYNAQTHHLINRSNIHRIKRGALLINTARGGLVETEALTLALDQGILSGAGLDVLEGEELIKEERQILSKGYSLERLKTLVQNHILLNRENVVITPHIAFNSREAFVRIIKTTVANIEAYLAGRPENSIVPSR